LIRGLLDWQAKALGEVGECARRWG
jgi:hypothetical protein